VKSFRAVAAAAFNLAKPLVGDTATLDTEQLREEMAACIEGRGGDVATRQRATAIGTRYALLSPSLRSKFFEVLAKFDVNRIQVDAAVAALTAAAPNGRCATRSCPRACACCAPLIACPAA
jgi:hypothetical protein